MPPLQISLDEAREEGMQKGMQARERQVILKMFQKKLDISVIAEVTGLSEKQIKKLQKKQ